MAFNMTSERYRELWEPDAVLTAEELAQGWHWCPEWDDLHVGPVSMEWGDDPLKCQCGLDLPILPEVENEQTPGG